MNQAQEVPLSSASALCDESSLGPGTFTEQLNLVNTALSSSDVPSGEFLQSFAWHDAENRSGGGVGGSSSRALLVFGGKKGILGHQKERSLETGR